MQVRLISDQGGNFDEYFANVEPSSYLQEGIKRTRDVLNYLKQNIDAPPRWVTISHYSWFYLSETDHWDPWKAGVHVYPKINGYEIKYRSAPEHGLEKSFTILYAHSLEEAGAMIADALARALPDPPGNFPPVVYNESPRSRRRAMKSR